MLATARKRLDRLLGQYQHAAQTVQDERKRLQVTKDALATGQAAQGVLQAVSQSVQKVAHRKLADVVSRCLSVVFGPDAYTFQIEFERRRCRTEADLRLVRDGHAIDAQEAAGGGVNDVVSIALRLVSLLLVRPKRRLFLALDEPTRHLDEEHAKIMGQLLVQLAKEMGFQLLIVTHSKAMAVGKVIHLGED
jgi:DNA repair exonuclease SbcCD ATPase subunit